MSAPVLEPELAPPVPAIADGVPSVPPNPVPLPPSVSADAIMASPSTGTVPAAVSAVTAPVVEDVLPPEACETLYIQNLNEAVKIDGEPLWKEKPRLRFILEDSPLTLRWMPSTVIKITLRNLFKHYGPVLDVVAHRNIRMRGQAFVSFEDKETAYKALKEVKGFPLYAKPMVSGS